jgi:PAS domain-containing protein
MSQAAIELLQQEIAQLHTEVAALEQREAYFREFVEGADDMITQVDGQGNFTVACL